MNYTSTVPQGNSARETLNSKPYESRYMTHFETVNFSKNDLIYMPGSVADKVYFIHSGRIKLGNFDAEGKEVITSVLFEDQIFGEECLINSGERTEYAKAMGDTVIKVIPSDIFNQILNNDANYAASVTKLILKKLVQEKKKWYSKMTNLARPRIITFLVDLANDYGKRLGYEVLVNKFFTHHELACLTGTARQTVSSVLNELKKKNLIYFDRKKIIYRDLELLKAELTKED